MTTATYSIEEYAAALMGPGPDGTAATVEPSKVEWLRRRLSGEAKPVLPGFKVARQWRATDEDIDTAIKLLRPQRVSVPVVPSASSMTQTSRRRLASL
jgi:hypothetical protein